MKVISVYTWSMIIPMVIMKIIVICGVQPLYSD